MQQQKKNLQKLNNQATLRPWRTATFSWTFKMSGWELHRSLSGEGGIQFQRVETMVEKTQV